MSHPAVSPKLYFLVFVTLIALTSVTVGVAYLDLGPLNTVVALTIAGCKTLLVILYFMHARYSSRLTWVFAGVGFLWLAILIAFTMSDMRTRSWQPAPSGWTTTSTSWRVDVRESQSGLP
jgi:cytochrome c oxidase subunit IV